MLPTINEAIERLWPLSASYEYAAELGLGLRMADPGAWLAWDSQANRDRYRLPQALGYQFLLHLEDGDRAGLTRQIVEVISRADRRLLVEIEAALRCLDEPGESKDSGPLPPSLAGLQIGLISPKGANIYPGRRRLFGSWLQETLNGAETVSLPFDRASDRELARVHSPSYISGLDHLAKRGGGLLTPETSVFLESPDAFRDSAGAMISAARESIRGGRPVLVAAAPGSHHAERSRAGGTCLVNNLAVAAEASLQLPGIRRVAILDLDAHHGNGSEEIFLQRPDVLTISVHAAEPFFPGTGDPDVLGEGRGRGFNMNLAVGDGESWRESLEIAGHRLDAFAPDLILVELSADAHRADPVSPLAAADDDFRRAGEILAGLDCPVVAELGASSSRRAWIGAIRSFLDGLLNT